MASFYTSTSIGRFRKKMPKRDIAFIQSHASKAMQTYNYELESAHLLFGDYLLLYVMDWPTNLLRMSIWDTFEAIRNNFPSVWKYLAHLLSEA